MTAPHAVALALGSNLGDRMAALRAACVALAPFVRLGGLSPVYETAPAYVTDQPAFLNAVVLGTTALEPEILLATVKAIEREVGRQPTFRYGPRVLDIDILFYDSVRRDTPGLTLPHPRLAEREFVLRPLADVAPAWIHPVTGKTAGALLAALPNADPPARALTESLLPGPLPTPLAGPGGRPLVMGILNATPDSFSGDGFMNSPDPVAAALERAGALLAEGVDLLDVGGESTRPGAAPVEEAEEIRRVIPVVAALHERWPTVPLSVDTTKTTVARDALAAGAVMINDVGGAKSDPALLRLAAERNAWLVRMDNASDPGRVDSDARLGTAYRAREDGGDSVAAVAARLRVLAEIARAAGVRADRIILDPGLGFGKNVAANLRLIRDLDSAQVGGYPLLIGASRKSFIGKVLDLGPEDRVEGSLVAHTLATLRGAAILRVHDVRATARAVRMATAFREA